MEKSKVAAVVAMVLWVCASATMAGIIVQDDFNTGPLDTSKWYTVWNPSLNFISYRGSQGIEIRGGHLWSYASVAPQAGEKVVVTVTDFDGGDYNRGHAWGLVSDSSWLNTISIFIADDYKIYAQIRANGGPTQMHVLWTDARHYEGPMTIEWTPTSIKITHGWWPAYSLDTTVQTTDMNGNPWVIPTAAMKTVFAGGYNSAPLYVDSVKTELIVPEPATMILLGLGSLILLKRTRA